MSVAGSPSKESLKDVVSSNSSADEGLPREPSELSLASRSSNDELYRCNGHSEKSLQNMYGYWQAQQLCDVTLVAEGRRIPVHKIVLATASAYFAAMFNGALRESKQEEITLEIDSDALRSLVQYCYTGAIELREETVETLLSTACLLQLNTVVNACCTFLQKQLDPSNCLGIAMFAEQQSCSVLQRQAMDFTCRHFMEVCQNQEFLVLGPTQLATLLRSEDLNVPSEECVFESVMSWVQHDQNNRERFLPSLLEFVKLPLLTPSYIVDRVEGACSSIKDCQGLIMEAVKWHLLPERRSHLSSNRTRPRTSTMGKILAVGGMDSHKGATSMELYDPLTNNWSQFVRMSGRRLQFGVAIIQDKLLVVGGRDGLKTLNSVESFDLSSAIWSVLPPMSTHRHGLGVAVMGEGANATLYAVGGHDGWSYLNTVERWDPVSRSWSYVSAMASARSTCAVAVLNGKLYAVGGRDGSSCLNSVEVYSPHANRWSNVAPMIRRRGGAAVAAGNGALYVLGGNDTGHSSGPAGGPAMRMSCVERYDVAKDTWILIANLGKARDAIGACMLADRLLAVGGYDGNQYLRTVEQYDPDNNEWRALAPLIIGRAGACIVPVPHHLKLAVQP